VLSPAKLNLFLAVTGRRPDGFHDLVSLAAPLAWGDDLTAEPSGTGQAELVCSDPDVPTGQENLILKAATAFAAATGQPAALRFHLTKRIPLGAGLGGGSSNAAAALVLLNRAAPRPLAAEALIALAARLGSDCPLFMGGGPVVMRGRGERLSALEPAAQRRIAGRPVLVFKPGFAISTPWAYGQLAAGAPDSYLPPPEAERRLGAWLADQSAPLETLLYNNMESPAFAKFPALPALAERIFSRHGVTVRMSGSGSACFAILPQKAGDIPDAVAATVRESWGSGALCVATNLASGQIPV
jgi:4-diphosphocytidyl-2-C-methyl-D-erythritol kinase